jgi:multiple sugar transport system permease protein
MTIIAAADQRSHRIGFASASFRSIATKMLLYTTLALVAIIWAAPILWMLASSFKPAEEIYRVPIDWIPDNLTLDAYQHLFAEFPIWAWFRNSLIVAATTTAITVSFAALAAYPLARMRFKGRQVVMIMLLSTFLLPYELLMVPLFLGLNSLGISDSYFSLAVPPAANALAIFILTQFFQNLPRELEEAAIIDGCSRLGFFFRILLPLSLPSLATVSILTFVASWNNFFWPLIVSNSSATQTLPIGLAAMVAGSGMSMKQSVIMASAVVATVPSVIFFFLLQRFFVQSVATTGIRG